MLECRLVYSALVIGAARATDTGKITEEADEWRLSSSRHPLAVVVEENEADHTEASVAFLQSVSASSRGQYSSNSFLCEVHDRGVPDSVLQAQSRPGLLQGRKEAGDKPTPGRSLWAA